MKRRRKIVFVIVAVFLIVIAFVLAVNFLNLPFPYLNPPGQNTSWLADISFGQPPGISVALPNAAEILINVNATGILVSGEPARIIAVASTTSPLKENLSSMIVSFEGAVQYLPISSFGYVGEQDFNYSGVQIQFGSSCFSPVSFGSNTSFCGRANEIEWPAEGSYYPMVTFIFKNGTTPRTVSFPDYRITISSVQTLSEARYNRINELLTIALVGFAFVEGIKILYDFSQEEDQSSQRKMSVS
jgi:hypothetical protein